MRHRRLTALAFGIAGLVACGQAGDSDSPASEAVPIAGMYEVSGVTVETRSGNKRSISGTIILAEEGDAYTATFNLHTTFPGADTGIAAEVIGKGSGTIEGRTLRGTAETQIVMATVPGVDPSFAFIPRSITTRIVSESITTIAADGSANIEIENRPVPGQEYAATRTTLRGSRVSGPGIPGLRSAEVAE